MNLNEDAIYDRFFNGGKYSLPYLLKFSCENLEPIYLVNNNENIEFENNLYNASSFNYVPPDTMGKSASLIISGIDNDLIEFVENANENFRLDVVGLIAENGEVQKIKQYVHFFGTVSYSDKMELSFQLATDDRLDMTFPPYKFDTEINKGNT